MPFQAIFIPVDFNRKVTLVEVDNYGQLGALLGGTPERAVYDRDAEVYVNGEGISAGLGYNLGASEYVAQCSDSAEQHDGWVDVDLYGNVVMTGPNQTDVPERLIEEFHVTQRQTVDELLTLQRMDYGKDFGLS